MAPIDIDTLRARIRAMDFERGTPSRSTSGARTSRISA